jgi:hypothetical protein
MQSVASSPRNDRFSRPRARFVFAKETVITHHEGRLALMIRTANDLV